MHYYIDIITHGRPFLTSRQQWWERVNNTVVESHLSVTNGSIRARTWTARLTDRDANDYTTSPPPWDDIKWKLWWWLLTTSRGRGSSTVVSVSVCQAGRPDSHPARSVCFRCVEFCQHAIDLFQQCRRLVRQRPCNVLSCLCEIACKSSPDIRYPSKE